MLIEIAHLVSKCLLRDNSLPVDCISYKSLYYAVKSICFLLLKCRAHTQYMPVQGGGSHFSYHLV